MSREIKLRTPGKPALSSSKAQRPTLRLVSEQSKKPIGPDPELKALLEELQRPRKKTVRRDDDDEPDAA